MSHSRAIVSGLMLAGTVVTFSTFGNVASANSLGRSADVSIYVGDLELTTEKGALTALARIRQAADRACGGVPRMMDVKEHQPYRACMRDITDRAVKKINSSVLTALYEKKVEKGRLALQGS